MEKIKSCANSDSRLFQNRSSSTESAHANTKASVIGHRLDSGGKSMQKVSKKREFFQVEKKMGLTIFLQKWNDFATTTEIGIVLEYFCGNEDGLITFFVRREERRGIGLRKFLSKKAKGRKGVGLRTICPSKRGVE